MDIKNVKRDERKKKTITLRTFPSYSKWMKENKLSPTKIFNEAVAELMKQNE